MINFTKRRGSKGSKAYKGWEIENRMVKQKLVTMHDTTPSTMYAIMKQGLKIMFVRGTSK